MDDLVADDGIVELLSILLLESCCNLRFLVGVNSSEKETEWHCSGRSFGVSFDLFSFSSTGART